MIVRNLRIDRFGILSGQELTGLSPGLNIFLGDNEAGKSTCRNFFRAMFFGYKRNNRYGLDYSGASGLEAGGGLDLQSVRGESFRLLRRPGKHGGELSLLDALGRELSPDLWQGYLSGVTAELYDRVFAFDLSDLTTLESMGDSKVAAALHGAAFGTGFKSPSEVLARLDKEMGELFSPSGNAKNQAMNIILRRLQQIREQLSESGSEVERHSALKTEQAAIQERRTNALERQRDLQARRDRLQSLFELHPQWLELRRLENELALHPHPGGVFGPESLTRLEKLCAERDERLAALESRRLELASLEEWLRESTPDQALLEQWPRIRELNAQRLAASRTLEAMPLLDSEIRSLDADLSRYLAALGRGWTREKAASFELTIASRDHLARFSQRLESSRQALERAVGEKERIGQEYSQAVTEEKRLRRARAAFEENSASGLDFGNAPEDCADSFADASGNSGNDAFTLGSTDSIASSGSTISTDSTGSIGATNAIGPDYLDDGASGSLYGPEMRLLLEDRWRRLEQAQAAQSALEGELARLEQESRTLDSSAAGISERIAALDHELIRATNQGGPSGPFNQFPPFSLAGCLREVARFRQLWNGHKDLRCRHAEAVRQHKAAVPPLFSARPLSDDKRRALPLAISLLVAVLSFVALYFGASETMAATAVMPAGDGAENIPWLLLLKKHWALLGLGLGGLWSAVFWLNPKMALLGRWQQRPDALSVQILELADAMTERWRDLEKLSGAIARWLPREFANPGRNGALPGNLDLLAEGTGRPEVSDLTDWTDGPGSLAGMGEPDRVAGMGDPDGPAGVGEPGGTAGVSEPDGSSVQNTLGAVNCLGAASAAPTLDSLEDFLFCLQGNQAQIAELERQLELGLNRQHTIALQCEEMANLLASATETAQAAFDEWAGALVPYRIGALAGLDGALQIFDRAARSDSLATALRQASVRVDAAASVQAALERDWAIWLNKTGLASENGMELTPAAAQDAFAVLEKIQERHALLEQKQAHKRALESELADFRSALGELSGSLSGSAAFTTLCVECGLTVNPDNTLSRSVQGHQLNPNGKDMPGKGLFALFDGLYRAAEDCVAQSGLRQERHRDLAALQARIAEAETALRQCESALLELFHLADLPVGEAASAFSGSSMEYASVSGLQKLAGRGGLLSQTAWHPAGHAASQTAWQAEQNGLPVQSIQHGLTGLTGLTELAELFRLRHAAYQAHESLRLERERCLMQLRQYAERFPARWSGYAELAEALDKLQADELKAEQERLEAELAEISASLLEDSARQGEIKAMLLELERGGAYAELRQEEAALKEKLAGQARRWMVLNIARSSILAAKRSFEEDRQDMVVRQAGDFFSTMTGGAYRGLTFDLESGKGGLKALALPTHGTPLDAEHSLSRGTREQLYLALRLAYIRQHNQTRESLPVIMDDILVNFDPGRAAKAASVLAEFASTNQVLFFTCHPGIAEILAGQSSETGTKYSTFRVEGGSIS